MATTNKFVAKNGLDNNGNTITNAGTAGSALSVSGAYAVVLTATAATNVTLPTSGTLARTSDLTAKADLANPTFTGVPLAPTAAVNTNTTQLATTQFVLSQAATATPLANGVAAVGTATRFAREDHVHVASAGGALTKVEVTATTHTATAGTLVVLKNAAASTCTLPASPAEDDIIEILPANGVYNNVIAGNGKTINGASTIEIDNPWACVKVRYINATIQWRTI